MADSPSGALGVRWRLWAGVVMWALAAWPLNAQLYFSELLFNPPGTDAPNEYIELRGQPNWLLPEGTYLVSIEGDELGNPGTVENVFDLSGQWVGGNGFLVLLQKGHVYAPSPSATVITNSGTGDGWGSGSSSSIRHRGAGGQTDLENTSVTYFLIETTNAPQPDDDIDADNDGTPDGLEYQSWTVLDSVGVLGNHGAGDIAYGAINFRRNAAPGNGAKASGTVVSVPFTPGYVGRTGHTTGSGPADWVASDNLVGTAPYFTLGPVGSTMPSALAGADLDHVGLPNFGAPPIAGVVITESAGTTAVNEGGATDSFTVGLNVAPAGGVTISLTAGPQVEISTDNGATFGSTRSLSLATTAARTVLVRAPEDNVVDTSPRVRWITNAITATLDAARYPLTALVRPVKVNIIENDWVLLNELKVNAPGGTDTPFDFVELRGPPDTLLTNVYLLALAGEPGKDPGTALIAANLSGARLGSNGLLAMVGRGHPYAIPAGTTLVTNAQLSPGGSGLPKGSMSFLLVSSPLPIAEGVDLDNGDNGILEKLPGGTTILDAVAWTDGDTNAVPYGGVVLSTNAPVPDAACRFAQDNTPRSAAAWFFGGLLGTTGAALTFDAGRVSSNFPGGAMLSPGAPNSTSLALEGLMPICGAIADPSNPVLNFQASNPQNPSALVTVSASSSDQAVVPDGNLALTPLGSGRFQLGLNPTGVGYAIITVTVGSSGQSSQMAFRYAASAAARTASRFHLNGADGSTAYGIDQDWMLIGDDENQMIRLFSRNFSGLPVKVFDPTPFLGLLDTEDGTPREVDLEGSTHVGSRIYWLGSHSLSSTAASRVNRSRIFATDLAGAGVNVNLTYVGRYDYLKPDLIAWDENNVHGKGANYYGLAASAAVGVDPKAADGSGFNLEGLSMAPGSATIGWIGFRAPLVPVTDRAKALIVPVLNFTSLAVSGGAPGSAVFGAPVEINLGGRGIRSIEANASGVLIVAGPPGPADGVPTHDFRLYTWTGNPANPAQERAADLSGMNPEGIVELPPAPWTSNTVVQLISDNGVTDFYGDGTPAKHLQILNFKKSRSDRVAFGDVVVPRPIIRRITRLGDSLLIEWLSEAGRSYRVQWRPDWTALWADLSGDVLADDATASKLIALPQNAQCFYRLLVVP